MKKTKKFRTARKNGKVKATKRTGLQQTAAGKARAEGLRLFNLAGRPKKEQVTHVFGKPGVAWTWVARARAVGMKSAEEVARKFPELLKKPSQSCLVSKSQTKTTAV